MLIVSTIREKERIGGGGEKEIEGIAKDDGGRK